jgi:hypothetical protein
VLARSVALALLVIACSPAVATASPFSITWLTKARTQRANALVTEGLSPDRRTFAWGTTERVSRSDHDNRVDLYVTRRGHTTLVTRGGGPAQAIGPQIIGVSDAGAVLFATNRRLVRADRDNGEDLYRWSRGRLTLFSSGSRDEMDPWTVPQKVTPDLAHSVFETSKRLTSDDRNDQGDVYEWSSGRLRLISRAAGGTNTDGGAFYVEALSPSGRQVVFASYDALTPDDHDHGDLDSFRWSDGTLRLVTSDCSMTNNDDYWGGSSDLGRLVFSSECSLSPGDTDSAFDLYMWTAHSRHLVSTGPLDRSTEAEANFKSVSADGRRVLFATGERLVEADHHAGDDLYERVDGRTVLVTANGFEPRGGSAVTAIGASRDLRTVYYSTNRRISRHDHNNTYEVYRWHDERTTYIPCQSGDLSGDANGWIPSRGPVVFASYQRCGTTRVSRRPSLWSWRNGRFTRLVPLGQYEGATLSGDGRRAFLTTALPLARGDHDHGDTDVYSFPTSR